MKINDPSLNEILREGESAVQYTTQVPRKVVGASLLFMGVPLTMEPVLRLFQGRGFIAEFVIGILLIYLSVREFVLNGRTFACVTNERVIVRGVDLIGRPGRVKSVQLDDIVGARLMQTAMAWRDTYRGEVLLRLRRGGQYITPPLENGQFILDAIRAVRADIAIEKLEAKTGRGGRNASVGQG